MQELQTSLINAQNSGKYLVTIHYLTRTKVTHHFFTKDFPVIDFEKCIQELKKYANQESTRNINSEET